MKMLRWLQRLAKRKRTYVLLLTLAFVALLGYALYKCWLNATETPTTAYTRLAFANVASQVVLSILTLAAVLTSLWLAGLKSIFLGPELELRLTNDELHCVPLWNGNNIPAEEQDKCLAIYVHVQNDKTMAAEDCRITCNEIYVSPDGKSFYKYKTLQTASFKWVYANKEEPYLATIRKRVEKYARIVEIIEQRHGDNVSMVSNSVDTGGVIEDKSSQNRFDASRNEYTSWLSVCLPLTPESDADIRIPTRYRGVMLPLAVVSKTSPESVFYALVVWNGDEVGKYQQAGFLEVAIKDPHEAKRMIKDSYKEG